MMKNLRNAALAAMMTAGAMLAGEAAIGSSVAPFQLKDASGKTVTVTPGKEATVVTFVSVQCPISNDYNDRMTALYKDYSSKGVKFFFVNANSTEPADVVADHRKSAGWPFEVYKDATAADALGAEVTPESYVFGKDGKLQYHGYIDDSRNAARVKSNGLRDALDAVLAGKAVAAPQTKAFGCTIKRARKS
jgi:thiol-disulfide isomerase/thioredoxin